MHDLHRIACNTTFPFGRFRWMFELPPELRTVFLPQRGAASCKMQPGFWFISGGDGDVSAVAFGGLLVIQPLMYEDRGKAERMNLRKMRSAAPAPVLESVLASRVFCCPRAIATTSQRCQGRPLLFSPRA